MFRLLSKVLTVSLSVLRRSNNIHLMFATGLMLWYPLSSVAALWFVAIAPSSYLAGIIACVSDERLAPSFRRHIYGEASSNYYKSLEHLTSPRTSCECPEQSRRHQPASSSRSLGPYCITLNTGVVDRTWTVGREFESHVHYV